MLFLLQLFLFKFSGLCVVFGRCNVCNSFPMADLNFMSTILVFTVYNANAIKKFMQQYLTQKDTDYVEHGVLP